MSDNITHLRPQKINTVRVLNDAGRTNLDSFNTTGFPSLQSALDDLPAYGGTVFVELGTKSFRENVTISVEGTHLVGAGKSGTIFKWQTTSSPMLNVVSANNCTLRDFMLDGSSSVNSLLYLTNSSHGVIDNVWFKDALFYTLFTQNSVHNRIANCFFTGSSSPYGIVFSDQSDNNTVEGCRFTGLTVGIRSYLYDGAAAPRGLNILNNYFLYMNPALDIRSYAHRIMGNNFVFCNNSIILGSSSGGADSCLIDGNSFYSNNTAIILSNANRCYIGMGNMFESEIGTLSVTVSSNSSFNVIWNLYGYTITDNGTGTVIFNTANNSLDLAGLNGIGVCGSDVRLGSYGGTNGGYIRFADIGYIYSPDTTKYIQSNNNAFEIYGIMRASNSDNSGIAVRYGSGSATDAKGGNQDGCIYIDTDGFKICARIGGVWKSASLA